MKVHSDVLIFELLKLYFEGEDKTTIDINTLKKGFHTLIEIINQKHNMSLSMNFDSKLMAFLEKYSEYFDLSENKLELIGDIKVLFNEMIDSYEKLTIIDYDVQELVFSTKVYNELGIHIPYNIIQGYFELNQKIIRTYLKLGEKEFNGNNSDEEFQNLKNKLDELKECLNDADTSILTKLKIWIDLCNNKFLKDTDENRSAWSIILFSNNPQRIISLSYARLEHTVALIDPEIDEENEETLNSLYAEQNNETEEEYEKEKEKAANELDEIPYFLTILLININHYLKRNLFKEAREALLIKKYLLISCPELRHVEEYFLENHNLDEYPLPPIPEEIDNDWFEVLKKRVIKCTTYLAKENSKLEKPHVLGNIITAALFIKTYLELSINDNSKQDIIDLITNSIFYKKSNYEEVTKIVDEIIFNSSPSLFR